MELILNSFKPFGVFTSKISLTFLLIIALQSGAETDIKFCSMSASSTPTILYVVLISVSNSVISTVAPNVTLDSSSFEVSITSALVILFSSSAIRPSIKLCLSLAA